MQGNYRHELPQLQLKSFLTECSEIKQRRQRRQRERQKSNRFTLAKQQLCTCITLFVHFSAVTERLQRENTWFLVLWKNVNTRQRLSFSFPEHRYSLLEFNSRENCQHLMNWTRWNKCDKVWNSAASLFKPPITISQYAKTLCTSSTSHKTQMHKPQGKKTAKLSVRLREIVLFPQI